MCVGLNTVPQALPIVWALTVACPLLVSFPGRAVEIQLAGEEPPAAREPSLAPLVEEIRQEAARANRGGMGRPLPLAAHSNISGADRPGFAPPYQLRLLQRGHHNLP